MSDDAASILFPDDAPKAAEAPQWFQQQIGEAEKRLSGDHGKSGEGDDPAATMFKSEGQDVDYAARMGGELDQHALDAIADGDGDRADALKFARDALAEDFRTAGTDPDTIAEAFKIVRDAPLSEMSPEQHEAAYAEGMAELERSGVTEAEINAARKLVSDFELIAPGTVASLEANSAGSNPKLVRMAIAEAKRRGYLR